MTRSGPLPRPKHQCEAWQILTDDDGIGRWCAACGEADVNHDRFPQAMVEATTEYDWAELPDYLQDIMRNAAREFNHWATNEHSPLIGELANEIGELNA